MTQAIPPALHALLQRQLAPGERVVWQGRPSALRLLGLRAASMLLVTLPVLAVGAFLWWMYKQAAPRSPQVGRLAPLMIVPVAWIACLMLCRTLWACWKDRRTVYAVTDRRALVLEAALGRVTVQAFSGEQLSGAVLREGPDGWGDLVFERVRYGSGRKWVFRDAGFFRIADVARVQRCLPVPAGAER